jgi:DNA replication protein DnaC
MSNESAKSYKEYLTKAFYEVFHKNVPLRYREIRLQALQPSDKSALSLEQQADIIKLIQAKPGAGYAFFGPPGTSKTTFCVALYERTLRARIERVGVRTRFHDHHDNGTYVWRITAKELLDQFRRYECGSSDVQPLVTRRRINSAITEGRSPRLFLEEIDKVKGTDFKLNALFEVIDALYEQQGQLVLNSNFTPQEFSLAFGSDIERRITEMCTVVDFFENKGEIK